MSQCRAEQRRADVYTGFGLEFILPLSFFASILHLSCQSFDLDFDFCFWLSEIQ